jgi:hypothetical protein
MANIELADVLGITRNLMASTSALVPKGSTPSVYVQGGTAGEGWLVNI